MGYQCYRGACRQVDGGIDPGADGTLDGDPVAFDAVAVFEGGPRAWHKTSFSHLDTELVSKEQGMVLATTGMKLSSTWGQFGANLLSNPGFETGTVASWNDQGSLAATVGTTQAHGGSYSVGGGASSHELYQDVDLTPYALFIDNSRAKLESGLWMLHDSASSGLDKGRLTATFFFGSMASLNSYDSGEVSPSTWTQYLDERLLEKGIRKVRIWHKGSDAGSGQTDIYADDATVRVKLERFPAKAAVVYGRTFSEAVQWGVLSWSGVLPPGTGIACEVRSSSAGLGGWGEWSRVTTNTGDISSLTGVTDGHMAIEVKFTLTTAGVNTPTLTSFLLQY